MVVAGTTATATTASYQHRRRRPRLRGVATGGSTTATAPAAAYGIGGFHRSSVACGKVARDALQCLLQGRSLAHDDAAEDLCQVAVLQG